MRVVIEYGSPAYRELERHFRGVEPVRKVSLEIREGGVAVKCNEDLWTPTLSVEA